MLNENDAFVWPAEFVCTIIDENIILPNHYNLKVFVEPYVPVTDSFGIGFEKLKHIIFNVLNNSVIINAANPLANSIEKIANNIVLLPAEPYDYYIGSILFSKFSAITEKYFSIYKITIDSAIGDRVQYTINDPIESALEITSSGWWNQDNPFTGNQEQTDWDGLPFNDGSKFVPKIIKGGKSED
jgi:hypothetical protein